MCKLLFKRDRNCKNRSFYGGKRADFHTRHLENKAELCGTRGSGVVQCRNHVNLGAWGGLPMGGGMGGFRR